MSFFMAAVLFVPGVVLGTLLASGLISALGWNFLSLAALLALPPPLGPLVQAALAPGLIASWLALLVLVFRHRGGGVSSCTGSRRPVHPSPRRPADSSPPV